MKKIMFPAIILALSATAVKAQSGFAELIKSGPGDATKLSQAYTEPLYRGFGVGMNSGWTNTAKTKGFLKFDVRVSVTGSFVPSSDKSFDVTQIGLSNHIRPANANQTIAPTAGGSGAGPTLFIYDDSGNKIDQFNMPSGKTSVVPVPQLQATVGVGSNTDVTLRGIPKINMGKDIGSLSMIGFSVKHNIIQDFAGATASKVIPFDLALVFGYNRMNYNLDVDVNPSNGAQPVDNNQNTDFSNQRVDGHFNAYTIQAIASKKFMSVTPFLAVGYNSAKTDIGLLGNYPVTTGINNIVERQPRYSTFTDPVTIKETSISGMRADIGLQLDLGLFRFYASYGAAKYQSVTAGIGLGL